MKADSDFPRLTPDIHRPTSPAAIEYNCVAWAAEDTENGCQPGEYWPVETPAGEFGIATLLNNPPGAANPLATKPGRARGRGRRPGDARLVAHHRAFSSFNQISASMRRNWTS